MEVTNKRQIDGLREHRTGQTSAPRMERERQGRKRREKDF